MAGTAHAQCGGGISSGGGNCTPPTAPGMPGYESSSAGTMQQPQASYVSQWGAVAIDDDISATGTVTGRMSKREAVNDALDECAAQGGKACRIFMAYDNECAAIAWHSRFFFMAGDRDIETAKSMALSDCSKKYSSRQIVYSACSLPRRTN